jgi:hypothetical protein
MEGGLPGGAAEVERDAPLVAVDGEERGALPVRQPVSRGLAGGVAAAHRLDLDHVGAEIAEQLAAEGPGHHLGEVDDRQMRQRERHRCLPYWCAVWRNKTRTVEHRPYDRGSPAVKRPPNVEKCR